MELTPSEQDRLLIFTAAQLADSRRARGVLLNAPEATALIAHAVIEAARDGATHAQAMQAGQEAVSPSHLMDGAAALIGSVSVEAVFEDGRRLVVVDIPAGGGLVPGEVVRLEARPPLPTPDTRVTVRNTAPIAISVTTHFHFFEVNPMLHFDRAAAYGMRLAIPAGEHVDFPAGAQVEVGLVPIDGDRVIMGFAGLVDGPLDAPGARERAVERAKALGYWGGA